MDDEELEYIEDEGSNLWDQGVIFRDDDTGKGMTLEGEQQAGEGEYITEEEVEALEAAEEELGATFQFDEEAMAREREMLMENLKYGVGTGLLIGGWMALVKNLSEGSTARDNARFIGLGIVSGALLGMAIGNKSMYAQRLRADNLNFEEPPNQYNHQLAKTSEWSLTFPDNSTTSLNYQIRF